MKTRNFVLTLIALGIMASGCNFTREKVVKGKDSELTEAIIEKMALKVGPYKGKENLPIPEELSGENLKDFQGALAHFKTLNQPMRPQDVVGAPIKIKIAYNSVQEKHYKCFKAEVEKYAYDLLKKFPSVDAVNVENLANQHYFNFKFLWYNMLKDEALAGIKDVKFDAPECMRLLHNGFQSAYSRILKENGLTLPAAFLYNPEDSTFSQYNTIKDLANGTPAKVWKTK